MLCCPVCRRLVSSKGDITTPPTASSLNVTPGCATTRHLLFLLYLPASHETSGCFEEFPCITCPPSSPHKPTAVRFQLQTAVQRLPQSLRRIEKRRDRLSWFRPIVRWPCWSRVCSTGYLRKISSYCVIYHCNIVPLPHRRRPAVSVWSVRCCRISSSRGTWRTRSCRGGHDGGSEGVTRELRRATLGARVIVSCAECLRHTTGQQGLNHVFSRRIFRLSRTAGIWYEYSSAQHRLEHTLLSRTRHSIATMR